MKRPGRLARRLAAALPAILAAAVLAGAAAWRLPPPASRPAGKPRVVPPRPPLGPEPVTFNKQVVRILQANCQKCHHAGGIAPFALTTYRDAYDHRAQIAVQTSSRTMPPWHVSSSCAAYQDDPSLAEADIRTLSAWVGAGAPEGNAGDLPVPLTFPDGWSLGAPDAVFTMPEPMTPDFARGDVYRCFVLPTGLTQDRYVSAVEVAPGSAKMVHHVILFVDTTGASEELDRQDPGPGYSCFGGPGFTLASTLGGWAPGNTPKMLPDGIAMPLSKGARIVMQVHYSALSGVREPDRSSVALYYARQPVRKRLLIAPVINTTFVIPAGAADQEVTASISFVPADVHLYAITPHMHLLGRRMSVTATLPDGRKQCLGEVPDWNFHWQRSYSFQTPIALPFGSRVDLSAHYDNSTANPQNPVNPPRTVGWGENTTDEMCIAFLSLTLDVENLMAPAGIASAAESVPHFWEVDWPPSNRDPEIVVPPHWHHGR